MDFKWLRVKKLLAEEGQTHGHSLRKVEVLQGVIARSYFLCCTSVEYMPAPEVEVSCGDLLLTWSNLQDIRRLSFECCHEPSGEVAVIQLDGTSWYEYSLETMPDELVVEKLKWVLGDSSFTLEKAAAILNTSVQYVDKLLVTGQVDLTEEAVRAFKKVDDVKREKSLQELTRLSQEYGGYDGLK